MACSSLASLILLSLLAAATSHAVRQIAGSGQEVVSGYVSQAKTVAIPFRKCFRAEPQLEANRRFVEFKPTRVGLRSVKSYSLKNEGGKVSVLDELRTAASFKHRSLLVFDTHLLVFFAPNTILVVQQTEQGFSVRTRYYLQDLGRFEQFKMYPLGQKALLVVYNKQRAYLLDQLGYTDVTLPELSTIVHLEQHPTLPAHFFAAQSLRGLTLYRLSSDGRRAEVVERYTGGRLGLNGLSFVVDVSVKYLEREKVVLLLDAELGVVEVSFAETMPRAEVVVGQRMCESFDSLGRDHLVLLCQSQGHSTIVEAFGEQGRKGERRYRKVEPVFYASYLNDLHVTEDYYLVYSYKSLHVFWNTQKHRLPETLQTQSELALPGLETFALPPAANFIYTIEAGELNKYALSEEPASLSLRADAPLVKVFTLFLYGSCDDLRVETEGRGGVEACKVKKEVLLRVVEEDYPREEDFSISASFIVILITVFLLVIWICLKKYKGLEREARKVLENYQRKRTGQRRPI